jgi:hypothetical protein
MIVSTALRALPKDGFQTAVADDPPANVSYTFLSAFFVSSRVGSTNFGVFNRRNRFPARAARFAAIAASEAAASASLAARLSRANVIDSACLSAIADTRA